ncbi:MAG TPA: nucleotidyltransferase domain-containing protein [Polyangiaceae bacterium]|nr:nucleotidyltransferase domain-containing protein [Polyangiaceae bacterium]
MLPKLSPHQAETVRRTQEHFAREQGVTALLLGGSLAHGFATPASDVDVMIVVSDDEHSDRLSTARSCFFSKELCTYESGYVDGKYISEGFIRKVNERGSEPARFAFKDAVVLFSKSETLPPLLEEVSRYPVAEKAERIRRFRAQFEAWFWYSGEALKKDDWPLFRTSIAKLSLFAGRAILARNELLYPYHKWFLRVLATATDKPHGFDERLVALAHSPTRADVEEFASMTRDFMGWEFEHVTWPPQFMLDSELNWLRQEPPVDDI